VKGSTKEEFDIMQKKREFTTYEGELTAYPTRVQIRGWREDDDGEIEWRIMLPESGKERWVPECDLNPMPTAPQTNRERFEELCSGFESPMVQVAAIEAITFRATQLADNEEAVLKANEDGLIHGPSWIEAMKRAAEIIDPTRD
jgi:hypothetical protein